MLRTNGIVLFVLRFVVSCLFLFAFQRLLFIFYYYQELSDAGIGVAMTTPFTGLPLDLSATAYMAVLPLGLALPLVFVKNEKLNKWYNLALLIVVILVFLVSILIHSGEILVYQEWKTKLSSRLLTHFQTSDEIVRTASNSYTLQFIFLVVLQLGLVWLVYIKWFKRNKISSANSIKSGVLRFSSVPLLVGLLVLMIRGGIGEIPITIKASYISNQHILNDLNANSSWHFVNSVYHFYKFNHDDFFDVIPQGEVDRKMIELIDAPQESHIQVVENKDCNLIFFVLEGWSAQMIESLGGEEGVTPNLDRMVEEGVFFTRLYASSWTSETGHASIFSGFPAMPENDMTQMPEKVRKMPSLARTLNNYSAHHHFGGSFDYGNIGGYMLDAGFDEIRDEEQLQHLEPKGKLGIHDEATFPYFWEQIEQAKQPFLYGLFTQSTHAPFDYPKDEELSSENDAYQASMTYADEQLGIFYEKFRNSKLYENTLLILVSDHGRVNARNENPYLAEMYHIPLLICGGALKEEAKGMRVNQIGSQTDIAKTLLLQMGYNAKDFIWSKDLLNTESSEFALHTCTGGYGWIDPRGHFSYQMNEERYLEANFESKESRDSSHHDALCYLTDVYRKFKQY